MGSAQRYLISGLATAAAGVGIAIADAPPAAADCVNALIWMPPSDRRTGDIVLVDSTNFTTLFGGTDSLKNLWHNLATMK
jgi:hypothetical protein